MARTYAKIKSVKPRRTQLGQPRGIAGMRGDIDDLKLYGKNVRVALTDALLDAPIKRTIKGASTLSLKVYDEDRELINRELLQRKFDINIDDLFFRFTGWKDSGETTELNFESRNVNRLRQNKGHVKALRNKLTRAEFLWMLIREERRNPIPFFSPRLHVVQPIRSKREHRQSQSGKNDRREPGLGPGADVTVKGVKASAEQIRNINIILDTAISVGANFREMSMAIACATQENNMSNNNPGDSAGPDSRGLFGQRLQYYPNAEDPVAATRYFLVSDISVKGGMIGYNRRNPDENFSLAIYAVQKCAYEYRLEYNRWKEEANNTVREYLGGSSDSVSVEVEIPYTFERKPKEDTWACGTRLADEVDWAWFEANNMVYYVAQPYLLRSRARMLLHGDTRGIDLIQVDNHKGKKETTLKIEGRAREWAAPPGTVVVLRDHGDANGRYLVKEITGNLFGNQFKAVASKPTEPLPEPAPDTRTKTLKTGGGRGGGRGDAEKMAKWAISNVGVTEGSSKQAKWASEFGFSSGTAWCSIFIAYGLKHVCDMDMPSAPAYSGAWFEWSGGKRVSGNKMQVGDLCIYDWGDGGITDHIEIYIGNNECVGGNEGNGEVKRAPFDRSSLVGVVRPNYG